MENRLLYGMQPRNNMRSLLLELHESNTQQGPILRSDTVSSTIFMDFKPPCPFPSRNYARTIVKFTTASCSGNHGVREDTFDFTHDGDRNDFEAQGMCDASIQGGPSKQKKSTVIKFYTENYVLESCHRQTVFSLCLS